MDTTFCKITEDHSVAVNETIALPCYNESEKEPFSMKWLIVDRLTRARLMSL